MTTPPQFDIAVAHLTWHEVCEEDRLRALCVDLAAAPVREPVHVAAGSLVILDGAHRALASRKLGLGLIKAHLMEVPAQTRVPGWTHVLEVDSPQPVSPGDGPVIGHFRHGGDHRILRATSVEPAALWAGYWAVARSIEGAEYGRANRPSDTAPSLTWVLPEWGVIEAMATSMGPLPAGVTRLGGVFKVACTACTDSSAYALPAGDDAPTPPGAMADLT